MLVAERLLIEFLLGPAINGKDTPSPWKHKDDICVDCFLHGWRLPPGPIAEALWQRRIPINKLVTHATWKQVTEQPRVWTDTRVATCLDGIELFAGAFPATEAVVSQAFVERVLRARQLLQDR